ncbi:hypothetical protein NG701_09235 [Pseudarthrobacter sp. HLT3-5]|uniref:hypothetical protein n=1 Tax=Pseudarthrobacter cellobiosi TaxID=2953654 RepID=UPI00208FB51F|nr:hypothetical protein [Pseudarthrobacter sp. HLT3-5]MCO4274610.1 hypothetical protein [Pseudarthrobacter sp. HLT3-5]
MSTQSERGHKMNARAVMVALVGTAFLVFDFPHILASFSMAPNVTETLWLGVGLWAVCWVASRGLDKRRRLHR